MTKYAANIITPMQTRIYQKKYVIGSEKFRGTSEKIK